VNYLSEIKRRKSESFEAFMRRVKRSWQQSGKLIQARKIKYFDPKKSKNLQKNLAIKKAHKVEKVTYLRKIGRMPEEEERFGRK